MSLWLKNPLAILADKAGGGLVIDDGVIVERVAAGAVPTHPVTRVFNAGRHVVIPGLINTHHHFYQTLTRAYGPALDKGLFGWLKTLYPVWARLEPHGFSAACRLAMAELLLSGCTTAADHHYVFPHGLEEAIDLQMLAAQEIGLRVMLCRGSMDLSVDDGGLPPRQVTQRIDTILADGERLINTWHQRGPGAMAQVALAPCSPFSVSGDLMRQTARQADALDVRLHTHLAETNDENDYCLGLHGMRPLDYIESLGWLSPRVWFAHGVHFNRDEQHRMGKAGVAVAHCPSSNMILGSGICPVGDLEKAGVGVGLAVDGSASNDHSNLMQEVRQGFLLQRAGGGIAAASHHDALRWATNGGAACLGRDDIGALQEGLQADLALFTLDELRFSGAGDPLAALVTCGGSRADRVMVAGQWRVIDGAVIGLDMAALRAEHGAAARRLQGVY